MITEVCLSIIVHFYFLQYFPIFSNCYILISHTENSRSLQYYDCLHHLDRDNYVVKYCHQLNESRELQRDFTEQCHHNGELWSFEELSGRNISVSDVLQWSSSIELTDRYSKYLSNHSSVVEAQYLCNCTNPSSFGKFCEYEFYNGVKSVNDALTKQFQFLEIMDAYQPPVFIGSQLHNNRLCYTTLECYTGLMCLDWRHICDGKQQCSGGLDENYCQLLEFNECEDDEYRCANGMCIPEEYWLDGEHDCMDWTDEINTIIKSGFPCSSIPSILCDEHICPYNQWSCADGRCLSDQTNRHKGIRYSYIEFCPNLRDVQFMCESITRNSQSFWTIDGGYCLPYPLAYQTLGLDTTAIEDICLHVLRCILSDVLNQDCRCKSATACHQFLAHSCSDRYLLYPGSKPLLFPYVYMFYKSNHDWTQKEPDTLVIFGWLKCLGYQLIREAWLTLEMKQRFLFYRHDTLEYLFCTSEEKDGDHRVHSGLHYDIHCWNHSKTFNHRSYEVSFLCLTRCISKYRVRDGISDCIYNEEWKYINNSCPQIQHHRLQCSSTELTCLLASTLGDWGRSCSNDRDEVDDQSGIVLLGHTVCQNRYDSGCVFLRNYIQMSSENVTNGRNLTSNSLLDEHLSTSIPFQSYCNSFFDLKSGLDELPELCQEWTCSLEEYRCLSGQCIPFEWICDGEWDCNDGSDEQRLFIITHLHNHNSKLKNLTELQNQCSQQYRLDNTPFSDLCNLSLEYPCFRTDVDDPLNVELNRPCIPLTQIGDGKSDCLADLDERNRYQCENLGMLGFHFAFNISQCWEYIRLCTDHYPWKRNQSLAYDSVCFYREKFFQNKTQSDCNDENDVMCLNDVCMKKARCNGILECRHGEDEYRCVPQGQPTLVYRSDKIMRRMKKPNLRNDSSLTPHVSNQRIKGGYQTTRNSRHRSIYEIVRDELPYGWITFEKDYLPFICNRGLAVKYYTGQTVCFCPSSFYGSQCEFSSDRLTILTHLDLTYYHSIANQTEMIKILVTLLFSNRVIDYFQFHVHPLLERNNNYIKQMISFLYPRTEKFIPLKRLFPNGTQLYSVRFEAFNLYFNQTIQPIGIWQYQIYFDFLPSFRLAKILRFSSAKLSDFNRSYCVSNPCENNGTCQDILNFNHSKYFCFCASGFFGSHCQFYDDQLCNNYCSPSSICKPEYRSIVTGNQRPLCLCPASTFGETCSITNNKCQSNPCMHGGTCIVTYNLTDINGYLCLCMDAYQGDHCQYQGNTIDLSLVLPSDSRDIAATTVSYNNYDQSTWKLDHRYQQVYHTLPLHLTLTYRQTPETFAPAVAYMKVYGRNSLRLEPDYYILYYLPEHREIKMTINLQSWNHCPLVQTLWHLISNTERRADYSSNSTISVFFYHQICQAKQNTNRTFTCFRDLRYLCICDEDHYRAECFGYNRSIDQCSFCLSNGLCLQNKLEDREDFLCVCPRCHHGKRCEYSNEWLSSTIDSLIVKDIPNNHQLFTGVYISIGLLIFLFGLFNNFNSFLTFIRSKPRKFGVGSYLLIISIIDQCSLLLLFLKIIHIILGTNGTLFFYKSLNLYSCKFLSYLLSVFTRLTYWITSFVTIERLCMVLFPTSTILKNPRLALFLSILTIMIVCGMHIHELLYYTIIDDFSYSPFNITLCVTNYVQPFISAYNRLNVLLHYFVPFLIQTISITIMIMKTAFSRARTSSSRGATFGDLFRRQLRTQKELYVTPIIIILSSLPQIILSFSYACTELKQTWQRYSLLTAYFLSYLPQMLGFLLYVLPSTSFSNEFRQTFIGKKLLRQQQQTTEATTKTRR